MMMMMMTMIIIIIIIIITTTVVTSGTVATFCNYILRPLGLFAGSKMSNFELIIFELLCI